MKFPLCCICSLEEAGKMKDVICQDGDGRIYLMEVNGHIKIGKTNNIPGRIKQHKQVAKAYAFSIGRVAYSEPMALVSGVESDFHASLERFRVPGTRELFDSTIEALIDLFDVEWAPATIRNVEEERKRREEYLENERIRLERQREKREATKARNHLILEAAKCIIEKGEK